MNELEELKRKISSLEKENKFLKRIARYYTTLGLVHCRECAYNDCCSHGGADENGADWFCADGEKEKIK